MDSKQLIKTLRKLGYDCRSYSGRGMFGKQCVGFTCPADGWKKLLLQIADIKEQDTRKGLADIFQGVCTDNMGRDIIMYFPAVEFPKDYKLTADELLEDGFVEIKHNDLLDLGLELDEANRFYARFDRYNTCITVYADSEDELIKVYDDEDF